jgi:hypothetical protein
MLLVAVVTCFGAARADGRAGAVEWSDGHKVAGAISLTPGKNLRLFTKDTPVTLSLDEVKEIRFTVEKEQMWEGFYFPNAGRGLSDPLFADADHARKRSGGRGASFHDSILR